MSEASGSHASEVIEDHVDIGGLVDISSGERSHHQDVITEWGITPFEDNTPKTGEAEEGTFSNSYDNSGPHDFRPIPPFLDFSMPLPRDVPLSFTGAGAASVSRYPRPAVPFTNVELTSLWDLWMNQPSRTDTDLTEAFNSYSAGEVIGIRIPSDYSSIPVPHRTLEEISWALDHITQRFFAGEILTEYPQLTTPAATGTSNSGDQIRETGTTASPTRSKFSPQPYPTPVQTPAHSLSTAVLAASTPAPAFNPTAGPKTPKIKLNDQKWSPREMASLEALIRADPGATYDVYTVGYNQLHPNRPRTKGAINGRVKTAPALKAIREAHVSLRKRGGQKH